MTVMLLEWVFTSVFLILVVLALRAALGRRVSAGLRYALWAVVLVRLLVPVQLFTSPIAGTWVVTEKRTEHSVYTPANPAVTQAGEDGALSLGGQDGPSAALTDFPSAPEPPAVPDPPEPPDFDNLPGWVGRLGWAWLAGSAAVALVFLLSNLRFYGRLRRERILLEGADCPLRVYVAVGLPSPCLFGIVRPAVYVTPEAAADPDMLRHVLAHELTHCRHGDHLWSLLRCGALAAHWWNPLAWLSAVLSRRDAELACDEGALKRLGDGQRAGYGNTLLALVTAKPRPGDLFRCATTMAGDKKSLKERIGRIAAAPKRVVWAVAAAVLVTALACVCAFGQAAEPAEADGPDPSPEPAAGQDVPEVEIAFSHAGNDPASSFAVPEEVLEAAKDWVAERFQLDAPEGVMRPGWGEYNEETGRWDRVEDLDPDHAARFDRVRLEAMEGPWLETCRGVEIETWRINYQYHTTTPEAAENVLAGGRYLTEDGWLCPTYPNCTYLFFQVEGGKRSFLTVSMINSSSPEDGKAYFYDHVSELLEQQGLAAPSDFPQTDLNRNGVPETLRVRMIDGGAGQRLDVWENGDVIFSEEGYYAHAGYNALFLYRDGGQDYLLRYHPYMGQGWCAYSYQLFTLENNQETAVRENDLEFDINFHPLMHEKFDPKVINAFMGEINPLLANSVQLLNTDGELLDTFEKEGRLYDSLWWLDSWEPVFVRDEDASLLNNLLAYQEAMEKEWYAAEPTLFVMNETRENAHVWLRYQDRSTQFDVDCWEWDFQPAEHVPIQVADLNHDGREEIVFSLVEGEGAGCLVEQLFVFDAVSLEQYDTSGLNEMVLNSIRSTGDEDWFYLQGPGMPGPVTLNKHTLSESSGAPVADAIRLGEVLRYTVEDGAAYCWLGCDISGMTLEYEGYMKVWLDFTAEGGFRCGYSEYVGEGPLE